MQLTVRQQEVFGSFPGFISHGTNFTNTYSMNFYALLHFEYKHQSGAWYAEAVHRAVITKLEKIKTLQGFKKFSGWKSRGNLP